MIINRLHNYVIPQFIKEDDPRSGLSAPTSSYQLPYITQVLFLELPQIRLAQLGRLVKLNASKDIGRKWKKNQFIRLTITN